MVRAPEGFKSEALRAALQAALLSPDARGGAAAPYEVLAQLLAKHGGLPGSRPNLKLAAAFGAEVAQRPELQVAPLLEWLAADESAPAQARAFLPVAAAHGFAQRILAGHDVEAGWRSMQLLAADERGPVRMGAIDALTQLATREGGADALVARASAWLDEPDRQLCYGAMAAALEVLAHSRLIAGVREPELLHGLLSRVLEALSEAPRSAARVGERRRLLRVLPDMLATWAAASRASQGSAAWFRGACEHTRHPELRAVLSQALQRMAELRNPAPRALIDELRAALEGSQKPLRDAARVRPGTGRGRRSRSVR